MVDPEDLPGLLFPAPGGPSLAAVLDAVGRVLATGRVAAVGIGCTWRPESGAFASVSPLLDAMLAGW